ncbi:hypothetical protein JXA63_05505 [Candidatus Woesebacteria bacterium]|nr:hypothetical protein [Candidatus Woesebacteria bacterium]
MSREQSHKDIASSQEQLLAVGEKGRIIEYDGKVLIAKHERHRFRENGLSTRNIYPSDTVELPYNYNYISYEQTHELVNNYLVMLKRGIRPPSNTTGIELEGTFVNRRGELERDVFNKARQNSRNLNPELMESTGEFVTAPENGSYLKDPVQIANGLGKAIFEGIETAEEMDCRFVITSNPEVPGNQNNTNIPYLNRFAPIVKDDAYSYMQNIPQQTRNIYESVGRSVENILSPEHKTLDWPNQSTHIHSGIAQHDDEKMDPRVALVAAHIRLSPFAKIIRSTLYSTRYFYGKEFDAKDTRAQSRWLLHTTHETNLPNNYPQYVRESITSVINGDSPDISRFTGGHDRTRITPKKTVEDIGAPATPDARAVLAFALSQEIMNTLALEALQYSKGDETKALEYLQNTYGGLLTAQPGLGENSDHDWDIKFNKNGYSDPDINSQLKNTVILIERLGNEYPVLSINSKIVNCMLRNASYQPTELNLQSRLGIDENGKYDPLIPIKGLVSDHKKGMDPNELASIQHHASKKQAEALMNIETEGDLLVFYGLK